MPIPNHPASSPIALEAEAQRFGCPELINLDAPLNHKHLNYLDLMAFKNRNNIFPDAVAEYQGRAVMYLLDEGSHPKVGIPEIRSLGQLLANRSEYAVLGVIRPGEIEIFPINIDANQLKKSKPRKVLVDDPEAPFLFQSIATGLFALPGAPKKTDYIFNEIHDLLTIAALNLKSSMQPLDILSVTGRALFFRFLCDRKIVLSKELDEICPTVSDGDLRGVFSNPESAAATSVWLDETFNGDLLPLIDNLPEHSDRKKRFQAYKQFYEGLNKNTSGEIFCHLEAILRGWKKISNKALQPKLSGVDWDEFNFAHIPIGVLSQVYETFSHQWDGDKARITSIHYTPKFVAEILVEETLAGLKDKETPVILDPACGAGMFLVLTFRALVRKHWERTGERPTTKEIHHILYNQLRGFDINESALRLAALSLYITAIEVNGTTRPPKILKVPHPLKDKVLYNSGARAHREDQSEFELGSLTIESVPNTIDGYVDAVIGNPPWTRVRNKKIITDKFTSISRDILLKRKIISSKDKYVNPDGNPDLPFLWRATEWVRPGGIIAMALPGRILLKQGATGKLAREAILKGLSITGILNGSSLEKTHAWPNMDVPWMLLWALNQPSPQGHLFHFLTPMREEALCKRGYFRIDYQSSHRLQVEAVLSKPWLLKALSVGSSLDVEVLDKIYNKSFPSLEEFGKRKLISGKGFSVSTSNDKSVKQWLLDLPIFEYENYQKSALFVNRTFSDIYGQVAVHQTCPEGLYEAPLLIIPKAPGESRRNPKAYRILEGKQCFNQSYYGYSAKKLREGPFFVSLLHLILHSQLFVHFCLTQSSSIGAAHRIFPKEDLDSFPFPPLSIFSESEKNKIINIANRLDNNEEVFEEIDSLLYRIYGLNAQDIQVIRDTIEFGSPYRSMRIPATLPPTNKEVQSFCNKLQTILAPFFLIDNKEIIVNGLPASSPNDNWKFLLVSYRRIDNKLLRPLIRIAMEEASQTGSSRIIIHLPTQDGFILGLLNERRHWSISRARLNGIYIVRNHLHKFPLENPGTPIEYPNL